MSAHLPLSGVSVLDFTQVVAGPYATQLLSLLGASVIKVERSPAGDELRQLCQNKDLADRLMGSSFIGLNCGKRSISIDLKTESGREAALRLAEQSDIVVENFKPGAMKKLGLDYADIRQRNESVIYCSISGFGAGAETKGVAAYDGVIQAASGLMSITGDPDAGPMRTGFPVCDASTGLFAALAIHSALLDREKTGRGRYVDVSMFESALSLMSPVVGWWTNGNVMPQALGNQAWSKRPTSDLFRTGDGHIMLTVNREEHFQILCGAIGRSDILTMPEFCDWPTRLRNKDLLRSHIEEALSSFSSAEWEDRLRRAGIAVARVASIPDAVETVARINPDFIRKADGESPMPMKYLNVPFRLDGQRNGGAAPAPRCGEHTDEILDEIGYSREAASSLRAEWGLASG